MSFPLPDLRFEPESAKLATRAAVAAAIAHLPADLDARALAAHIRAAIPYGVELLGTTPTRLAQEIAGPPGPERIGTYTPTEVDRLTAEWRELPWRIVPEVPLSAVENVALDEVLTDRVARGESPPTLRFWGWSESAVILGRCQSVVNEVEPDAGVAVLRRMSGGGAMVVQPHGAITYSLYLPESALAGLTIRQSYEVCDAWVIRALRSLGIDAHHVPVNDIACGEGKIGGAAQARRRGVVLHHTTIAYDLDDRFLTRVLRLGQGKLRERGVASAAKRVAPLTGQTKLPRETLVQTLLDMFQQSTGGTVGSLADAEFAAIPPLVAQKYGTTSWTRDFE